MMLSTNTSRNTLVSEFTSGSSGACFECLKTRKELLLSQMTMWRLRARRVPDILHRRLLVFANDVDLPSGLRTDHRSGEPTSRRDIYYGRLDYVHLTPRDLIDSPVDCLLSFIATSRPTWIRATPSNAYCFAKRLDDLRSEGVHDAFRTVEFIEVTGEVLLPAERQTIECVFGVPIVNMYGMREVWPIAYECSAGVMHLVDENVHLETVTASDLPEGSGEACLTALRQFAFPLIRYRTGDVVSTRTEMCVCGTTGTLIDEIIGRRNRMLRVDGRLMSSQVFSQMFKNLAFAGLLHADGFRVVQKSARSFEIMVAGSADISREAMSCALGFLNTNVAPDLDVRMFAVDRFPDCYDDKHFFFYSEVGDDEVL
jgi:phenylacetate-CoA ligase